MFNTVQYIIKKNSNILNGYPIETDAARTDSELQFAAEPWLVPIHNHLVASAPASGWQPNFGVTRMDWQRPTAQANMNLCIHFVWI